MAARKLGSRGGSHTRNHKWEPLSRIRSHLVQDVKPDTLLESALMLLSVASGIIDATTYPDYGVFAANQTGNTALLAVSALSLSTADHKVNIRLVGASLGVFIGGCLIFGQTGRRIGCTQRGWLVGTTAFQTVLVFIAAALRQWYATDNALAVSSISVAAALAFQSGGQISLGRTVNVPEISTAMVTTAYVDALVDSRVLAKHNRSRTRRICFVISFVIGCFIGAVAYRYEGPAFALMLAGIAKIFACVMMLFSSIQPLLKESNEVKVEVAESMVV